MRFVLDASITIRWCIRQQQTPSSIACLQAMPSSEVFVPSIWPVEVASVISRELNKGTIALDDAVGFFQMLGKFDITVATANADAAYLFQAARRHRLTGYDASYLELAIALGLPLATADDEMQAAAIRAGVPLLLPPTP
jgi:predicted nucleic acid-binding protein